MMKKLLVFTVVLLPLGCTVTYHGNHQVHRKKGGKEWGQIAYQDHKHLVSDLQRVCDNALWDSSTCAAEMALLPAGGRMVITVYGTDWANTLTTDYEYLILDSSGNEILRERGIPRDPVSYTDEHGNLRWYAVDFMQIPFKIDVPFTFYLINHRKVRRSEFLIKAR